MCKGGTANVTHTVGTKVWVSDKEETWIKGTVEKVVGDKISVRTEDNELLQSKADDCPLQNPGNRGVEDMTTLSFLHEPGVLWNIKQRFAFDDIYTYTGSILIAVNPFTPLPHLYGKDMMDQYQGVDLGQLSPHVYAIADQAFRTMRKENRSQSILVSGESGAGKTETAKLLMSYLAYMGGFQGGEGTGVKTVEQQVLESNPLLEAFGNARTVRNNNSSRFGKFTELQFNKEGRITGAAIRTYLLERSRVVAISDPERSYHIFYQLCQGATKEERAAFHLKPVQDFNYLRRSNCFQIPNGRMDDAVEYANTKKAMDIVGISPEDQHNVFRTVAAVLHMGNIVFGGEDEAQIVDKTSELHLGWCAELLGVPKDGLKVALSTKTVQMAGEAITTPLPPQAANDTRDSLTKTIYARLFDWLVQAVNQSIGQDPDAEHVVGVLDIAGFECFKINDLEQFCINLVNEKLQQHFNQHVFKMEQVEYEREKIDWTRIEFEDNQDVLDLIEKQPIGIISMLDEQCRFQNATGKDLAHKLYSMKEISEHQRFKKPLKSNAAFVISHYAGQVQYETVNFLDKNRDYVVASHQKLLGGSAYPFVGALFPAEKEEEAAPAQAKGARRPQKSAFKFVSVATQFKGQVSELMDTLSHMDPHYIRCIKPNQKQVPLEFENGNVLQQLRCGGVLEAVRISCQGYPTKLRYEDFVDHFWHLCPTLLHDDTEDRKIVERVVDMSKISGHQYGITKVFLKSGQMAILDKMRLDAMTEAAIVVQKYIRMHQARKRYRHVRSLIVLVQSTIRGMFARKNARFKRHTNAAIQIQTAWRRYKARKAYVELRDAAVVFQKAWRGKKGREVAQAAKEHRAALRIQTKFRGYRVRKVYVEQRNAAIVFQCAWRCKVARRELRARRQAARESTKLLADKQALEGKVKELQSVLNQVQNQRSEAKEKLRDERVALSDARERITVLELANEEMAAKLGQASAEELEAERAARAKVEDELNSTKERLDAAEVAAGDAKRQHDQRHQQALKQIADLQNRLSYVESNAKSNQQDLLQRLQNAVGQRDEARETIMELEARVKALEEEKEKIKGGQVDPAELARLREQARQLAHSGGDSQNSDVSLYGKGVRLVQQVIPAGRSERFTSDDELIANVTGNVLGRGYAAHSVQLTEAQKQAKEAMEQKRQQAQEMMKKDQDLMLVVLTKDLGFHEGRPVAALLVFRSCIHWKVFQMDRTSLFDKIIQNIGKQLEENTENNKKLSYWLTNTVTLLYLLQRNIKPSSGNYRSSTSRMTQLRKAGQGIISGARATLTGSSYGEASIHGGGVGGFRQVEAKYPALLFKQQLDAYVQRIFPTLRDNYKKAIAPLLGNCILQPKTHTSRGMKRKETMLTQGPYPVGESWGLVTSQLDDLLETLTVNHVPPFLRVRLFEQVFQFINVQLFNQLLLRRECCSFSNGEHVKAGLAELETWVENSKVETVGDGWELLRSVRQAVSFLVVGNKDKKSLDEISKELCPNLTTQQLYRISTMYWDDKYHTETVSHTVLKEMKSAMNEAHSVSSHSFLLDDNTAIPFNLDQIVKEMDDTHLYSGIPIPSELQKGGSSPQSFGYLRRDLKTMMAPTKQLGNAAGGGGAAPGGGLTDRTSSTMSVANAN